LTGWPWPLDGIQNFFEDLWNWIVEAATNAVKIVSDWIWGAIDWIWEQVQGGLNWVRDRVVDIVSGVWEWIQSGIKWLWDGICSFVSSVVQTLSNAIGGVWNWIVDTASKIIEGISNTLKGVWDAVAGALSQAASWLWEGLQAVGSRVWEGLVGFWENVSGAIGTAVNVIGEGLNNAVGTLGGWVSDALAAVAKALGEGLTVFWNWLQEQINGFVSWVVGGIQWLGEQLRSVFEGLGNLIIAPVTEAMKPGSPDPLTEQVAMDFGKGLLDRVIEDAKKVSGSPAEPEKAIAAGAAILGGLTLVQSVGHVLTMAFDATHPVKKWGTQEMFHRIMLNLMSSPVTSGIIAVPVLVGIVTPMRQAFNKMFTPELPGPGDLVRFVVKEAIAYEAFEETMLYHGYTTDWSKAWWTAHWRDLSADQIQDAYHRGVITKDVRDKYLVLIDYRPDARPDMEKSDMTVVGELAKTLIPRVDLRYGWELGRVTDQELIDRYVDLGYEDDAELMAEIQKRRALDAEIGKVRDTATADYIAGFTTEETLRANLTALGYSSTVVEYYASSAAAKRHTAYLKGLLDVYEDSFVKELITEEELGARVGEILVDPEAIDLFMDKAYVRKYMKPKPPKPETEDKATVEIQKYEVSRAVELYRRYVIERPDLASMLEEAGLDPGVATARAAYEEVRRPIEKPSADEIAREKERLRVAKVEEAAAVEAFRKETIDSAGLQRRLQDLGYSTSLAASITQLERLRALKKPDVPKADVVKLAPLSYLKSAFQEDLLPAAEFYDELVARGYSEESAALMVQVEVDKWEASLDKELAKIKPPEPVEPMEAPLTYVKASYQSGFIDDYAFYSELIRRGYSDEAATLIVQVERQRYEDTLAKEMAKVKPLPPPELKAAPLSYVRASYQAYIIDEAKLHAEIVARGYTEVAAALMVTVESTRRREREEKAAAA